MKSAKLAWTISGEALVKVRMDLWLSNKFRWLSLIATWAVICIHSRTDRWASGVNDYASLLETRVADLFFFAVPLFFVISGYMFVHSYNTYGWISPKRLAYCLAEGK